MAFKGIVFGFCVPSHLPVNMIGVKNGNPGSLTDSRAISGGSAWQTKFKESRPHLTKMRGLSLIHFEDESTGLTSNKGRMDNGMSRLLHRAREVALTSPD